MSGPSVTVQRAPDGWTHIGGPGMHLLIALDEEDERTLAASDAADGGDLDDVIDVLTTGGMRRAHHFVGVHWQPRTRLVAFGPVAARVVLADGSEREFRTSSPRVWSDLELDEHPESVELRVLDDAEQSSAPSVSAPAAAPADSAAPSVPAPAATSAESPAAAAAGSTGPSPSAPAKSPAESPAPAVPPAAGPQPEPGARPVPTFGGAAPDGPRPAAPSSWTQSWRRPEQSISTEPGPGTSGEAQRLPAWGSGVPVAARRRPQPPSEVDRDDGAVEGSRADDHSARDVQSTWSARPVAPEKPAHDEPATESATESATDESTTPSYDYLFGGTVTAEEHRRLLAQAAPDDTVDDELESPAPSAPTPTATEPTQPATQAAQPATQPTGTPPVGPASAPATATPQQAPGGLISSVPWARPTTPEPEQAAEAAPAFTGRHSPPPAPVLLPHAAPTPAPTTPAPATSSAPTPAAPTPSVSTPSTPPPSAPTPSVAEPATEPLPAPPAPLAAPTAAQPASPEPVHDTIAAEPDDAELTVDRSALLAARNAALDGPGPRVMAVLCTSGHPSPPHANRCRVCGQPIPAQEPFETPRPALGILRLSTGDIVTLDRNVLLGRAPKPADGLPPEEQPHVVKVPSPERDVSRNHVEVLVEGWHVLIRDLGTTNGTTVALPGESPVRMRANDQQSLEPGSVVSMADEVSFTYEVGA